MCRPLGVRARARTLLPGDSLFVPRPARGRPLLPCAFLSHSPRHPRARAPASERAVALAALCTTCERSPDAERTSRP
ncbi:hypothetical protein C2E23DRAFT_816685 [Lenzites betulinus]|nr:hypothetical protein C2E23DRAFT_816685 [Lenzites betulinus]